MFEPTMENDVDYYHMMEEGQSLPSEVVVEPTISSHKRDTQVHYAPRSAWTKGGNTFDQLNKRPKHKAMIQNNGTQNQVNQIHQELQVSRW